MTAALLLAGCGFQLRGTADLPYESLFVQIADTNPMGVQLKRNLRAGTKTRIVATAEEAEAILVPVTQAYAKTILSLNSAGRVREFRLRFTFGFRVTDRNKADIIVPQSVVIERDFPFNDSEILAKEAEEATIYQEMQADAVQQTLRRLAAAQRLKPEIQ